MQWSTACPDWEQRLVERRSLIPFEPLFQAEADAALSVFKSLRMVGVPRTDGKPGWATFGEACDQFVFDFVAAIFGSYDAKHGKRLISEFLLLISKKNGKSTIAAGIMLTALIRNWRAEGGLSIIAPTQKIAGNSFKPAAAMVKADPDLKVKLKVVANERLIRHLVTGAELKVIAADSNTVGGSQDGFVLIDELWLFGKRANAGDMLEEATGGLASRPEGFVVYLTTHSNEPPAGVFKEKLEYFRDVRDGVIDDPHSLGMLYEWPEAMLEEQAYLKPENFYVTNPSLGRSVQVEFIQRKLRKAAAGEEVVDEEDGETETLQVILAKYLNVEIGLKLRRDRWKGANNWEAAGDSSLTLEDLLARSEVVVIGIDGGGLDDLFGLCVAGRERDKKRWLYWFKAWAWPEVLKRRKSEAPVLRDFIKDGDLVLCGASPDATIDDIAEGFDADEPPVLAEQDVVEIVQIIAQVKESGLLPEKGAVGLDPQGVGALVDALAEIELVHPQVVAIGQGFRLSSAVWSMERKLKLNMVVHDGSRMMAWCVGNAKAEQKGNAVLITKQSAGKAKIDPLIAGFNATKLLEANPAAVSGNLDDFIAQMKSKGA
ncbi:MAG TPA: terminase large subunit [Sphingobium sp.]|uniref:terminase large subunit n=1 Tax=Sphingobium sp. TaxID=1912891 RepID=UPI002ED28F5A